MASTDMTLPPYEIERVAMLLGTVQPTPSTLVMARKISDKALAEAKNWSPIASEQKRIYEERLFKAVWDLVYR